jgi:hypothetical protein
MMTGRSSMVNAGIPVWSEERPLYPATYVEFIDVPRVAPYN